MVKITEKERAQIMRRFTNVYVASTKHHLFCEARADILRFLRSYRMKH